jgi:ribosomal protein S18 acetylase RimI-like enzyme
LREEDLDECYALCDMVFHECADFRNVKESFAELKNNKFYKFITAKIDGKIVGFTCMVIINNLFDEKKLATLWYVCTHPDYRRCGVGRKLFEKIEEIAKKEDLSLIYFTSRFGNHDAHAFYRKLGYDDMKEKAFYKWF